MRPDLAPGHVARIKELVKRGLLRRHRVPPRHRRLHGADRLSAGHRHRRLGQEAEGRVQQGAACARHRVDGARAQPQFRRQPVLHLLRRRALPRRPVHRLGQRHRRHGERRQDQARRAGERTPTRSSRRRWGRDRLTGILRQRGGREAAMRSRRAARTPWFRVPASRQSPDRAAFAGECPSAESMRTDLFDFDLPADRIALRPAQPRDAARLLVVRPGEAPRARTTAASPICRSCCAPGDCLVVNDTKVIAARLKGRRIGRGDDRARDRGDAAQAARRLALARLRPRRQEGAGGDTLRFGSRGQGLFSRRARCSSFTKR